MIYRDSKFVRGWHTRYSRPQAEYICNCIFILLKQQKDTYIHTHISSRLLCFETVDTDQYMSKVIWTLHSIPSILLYLYTISVLCLYGRNRCTLVVYDNLSWFFKSTLYICFVKHSWYFFSPISFLLHNKITNNWSYYTWCFNWIISFKYFCSSRFWFHHPQ